MKRGRKSAQYWMECARYLLVNMNDAIALESSPVARTQYVEMVMTRRYPGHVVARGRALQDVIRDCLTQMVRELEGIQPLSTIATLTLQDKTQRQIATVLGITPEHLCRRYRKVLIDLFSQALSARIRSPKIRRESQQLEFRRAFRAI